jgi:serine/threonine-protein kinase
VSHPGRENSIRREAEALRQLQGRRERMPFGNLPTLLPAYEQSTVAEHPYGKAVPQGEERYYLVFEHIEGEFLRDSLTRNPQPWYEHAVWTTLSLADAVALINLRLRRLHLSLSPDIVFVRTDSKGVPRPVLLDLGLLIHETRAEHLDWLHFHGQPAYTAPELTYTDAATMAECLPGSPASDVHGLGLLLYEMLAGAPVYEFRLRRDPVVREAVRLHRPPALARADLPDPVHGVVDRAIAKAPRDRYPDVLSFAKDLRRLFGEMPAEKRRMPSSQRAFVAVAAGAGLFSLFILLAALVG